MLGVPHPSEERRWTLVLGSAVVFLTSSLLLFPGPSRADRFGSTSTYSRVSYDSSYTETRRTGQTAPEFAVSGIDGKTYALTDLVTTRKAVLVNFFGIYCGPCIEELPHLESLRKKYEGQGLQVLVLGRESAERLKEFSSQRGYGLAFAYAPEGVWQGFGVRGIPRTFIIAPDRKIVRDLSGFGTQQAEQMEREIRELLNQREPAPGERTT